MIKVTHPTHERQIVWVPAPDGRLYRIFAGPYHDGDGELNDSVEISISIERSVDTAEAEIQGLQREGWRRGITCVHG